jgi:Flp pilus assembly protein TadD
MPTFSRSTTRSAVLTAAVLAFSGAAFAAGTPAPLTPASAQPSLPPTVHKERITLAREAIQARDWKTAIAVLTEAVQVHPGNPTLHSLLGDAYRQQATPDGPRSFENYRLALQFDPEHRGANAHIGEMYLMEGKLAKAQEHLAKLQRICGNTTCEEYQQLARAMATHQNKANSPAGR